MEKESFLKMWSKNSGKTLDEVSKVYDDTMTDIRTKFPQMDSIQQEKMGRVEFAKKLRRDQYSKRKAEDFFGFIFGASRAVNTTDFIRRKALKEYREDPQNAILSGVVDENGTPLDRREKIGQRDNPNYGKPLTEDVWRRSVYGVTMKDGDKEPMLFIMGLWRKTAKSFQYKPFVPLRFKALIKSSDKGFYQLDPSQLTQFKVTAEPIDMEKWIKKTGYKLWTIDKLDEAHDTIKDATDRFLFVEAFVDRIDPNVNPATGCRSVILADPEKTPETIRCFVDQSYPLGFGEYSKVIVLGQTRLWKRKDEDEEHVSIETYGIFPLPGETVEAKPEESRKPEIGFQVDSEEGFVIPFIDESKE